MTNKVEIVVTAVDRTGPGFASARLQARTAGIAAGGEFGKGLNVGVERAGKQAVVTSAKIGGSMAESIGSALTSGTGPIGAGLVAGLVAGAVAAAPLIGGIISASIVGAAGTGGIIGGIMLVKDDPRIATAAKNIGQRIMQRLELDAEPFIRPLLTGMNLLDDALDRADGNIQRIFASSATWIEPLARAISSVVVDLSDGLANLLEGAGPGVLSGLTAGLESFGNSLRESFDMLSQVGPEAGEAIQGGMMLAGQAIEVLTFLVVEATAAFGVLVDTLRTLREISPVFDKISELLGMGTVQDAEGEWVSFNGTLGDTAEQALAASTGIQGLISSMGGLNDALRAQVDPAFAVLDSQNKLAEARADHAKAVSKYGENSRQAAAAERDLALAALDLQGAVEAAGGMIDGRLTPALRSAFEAAGMTEQEIAAVERQMRAAEGAASDYEGDYKANLQANGIGAAISGFAAAKRAIDAIPSSKTVTIYSRVLGGNIFGAGQIGRASGGNVGAAASGGTRGSLTLVGEHGPEVVRLPFGSSVTPNGMSEIMMANAAAGYGDRALQAFNNTGGKTSMKMNGLTGKRTRMPAKNIFEDFSFTGMTGTDDRMRKSIADLFYQQNPGHNFGKDDPGVIRKFLSNLAQGGPRGFSQGSYAGSGGMGVAVPSMAGGRGGAQQLEVIGDTDSAFGSIFNRLVASGQIRIPSRAVI
jgi:hypothetical protein